MNVKTDSLFSVKQCLCNYDWLWLLGIYDLYCVGGDVKHYSTNQHWNIDRRTSGL